MKKSIITFVAVTALSGWDFVYSATNDEIEIESSAKQLPSSLPPLVSGEEFLKTQTSTVGYAYSSMGYIHENNTKKVNAISCYVNLAIASQRETYKKILTNYSLNSEVLQRSLSKMDVSLNFNLDMERDLLEQEKKTRENNNKWAMIYPHNFKFLENSSELNIYKIEKFITDKRLLQNVETDGLIEQGVVVSDDLDQSVLKNDLLVGAIKPLLSIARREMLKSCGYIEASIKAYHVILNIQEHIDCKDQTLIDEATEHLAYLRIPKHVHDSNVKLAMNKKLSGLLGL